MTHRLRRRARGFTLLELLVVVAILATVAGGLLVAYDGLDTDAAEAQATFNIAALDKAVRAYKTINKTFPDNLDSLMVEGADEFTISLPAKLLGDDVDANGVKIPTTDDGKLAFYTLTADGAAALRGAGITTLRYIGATASNTIDAIPSVPNRIFDDANRGLGVSGQVATGAKVAVIESKDIRTTGPATSERLRDIAGLPADRQHVVVAFGLGNNSTIVKSDSPGGLSEAPWYTKVAKDEYGRYLLLFHLASDDDLSGTMDSDEFFSAAKFLGVLDTRGDWLDEEFAEFTNQKT